MLTKKVVILFACLAVYMAVTAQELIYQDKEGIIRWTKNNQEIALFGANYCLPSACDYRAAGYVGGDRKTMIQEDLDHFIRMGWQALRVCFWGDWENSDSEGNLINNEHLDLMDFLITEASKRGIYMLFSPIVTYDADFPEMNINNSKMGFSRTYPKATLIHDEKAIQCQENYMINMLNHVNRYSGKAVKEEPNILFVELINEPTQFPNDIEGMIRYIERLLDAIKSTGCEKLTFYNISQDFNVAPAIRNSSIDGASYGWYPQGLNNGYTFHDNGLHFVDQYNKMVDVPLRGKSKIVYEFDASDTDNGFMYPAMVREFRRGGVQFATMFSYDMLRTASRNLGWQTHFLNMVYSPAKAVGGMIAAEVMRRVPLHEDFGSYPGNTQFGDFSVCYYKKLGLLNSEDMFYYSNSTVEKPKNVNTLKHVAGVGSSSIVEYDGTGIYFLDKIDTTTWVLEIYPDIMEVDDPFKRTNPSRICRQAIYVERNVRVDLPDLKLCTRLLPGKYTFENHRLIKEEQLANHDFFMEENKWDWQVKNLTSKELLNESLGRFKCEIYGASLPDEVILYLMPGPYTRGDHIKMNHAGGFCYEAEVDLTTYQKGNLTYHIGVVHRGEAVLFPAKTKSKPGEWSYFEQDTYLSRVIDDKTPLTLLDEKDNWRRIRRSRTQRSPKNTFGPVFVGKEHEQALRLSTPSLEMQDNYALPCDVTFSHDISSHLKARLNTKAQPEYIKIEAQGLLNTDKVILNFVDDEGRGYGNVVELNQGLNIILIPVESLVPTKAVMLPQDFPGMNDYWYPASTRMNDGVPLSWEKISFVQISLRDEIYEADQLKNKGVIVKKIQLIY